ncbi:flavodoxin domain-containing protein [Clostridium felsineum]|uniref:Uncharacterized protein n=1 Tax=Clostridium felsineum TaxID=36839 RepID=A0A1S8M8J8_9CLOT|nr:flavodoxin domain-containing protein [Clostridium felsineum]URZ05585.1 hypothetical protein CLROS_009110 [Clostridium felsineum]URZ10624.1 hypothetical protein CROST_013340 [Clostridium felsineum]
MKTLIIYATKHGSTKKCADFLKDRLDGEITVVNIKNDFDINLKQFDKIIIGGSIYMGKIQKEITEFSNKNIDILCTKKVGLFICGMNNSAEIEINNAFPKMLLENALIRECFGGEFIFKTMNFFERFIVRTVSKSNKDISKISEEKINNFAEVMNDKNTNIPK